MTASPEELSALSEKAIDPHAQLKALIEVPTKRYLWTPADEIEFVPRVLSKFYGDGRALFAVTTCNNRPAYWVVRGDSSWSLCDSHAPDGATEFIELIDDILTDLEDEFGRARCGYSGANLYLPREERGCDCEECAEPEEASWPQVDDENGCSWGRVDWPSDFASVPHPFSRSYNILPTPAGIDAIGKATGGENG
jgi:hypothetical protein